MTVLEYLERRNIMLEFIRSVFRGFYTIIFWLCLIVCTIFGGIIGATMGGYRSYGPPIIGGILGLIVGLIIDILGGGLIATFLNIDENIQIIATNMSKSGTSGSISYLAASGNRKIVGNKIQKKCTRCKKEVDEDYTICPHCGNNTFE
jgi:hypothetical protein